MSAIAGLWSRKGAENVEEVLKPSFEAIAHRGTGPRLFWADGDVALAFRPFEPGREKGNWLRQLFDSQARLAIAADMRLDNRADLFTSLGLPLAELNNTPDESIVLAAYRRWGRGFAAHLLGDFAVAIWDDDTKALICARDPMGVKPFYFGMSDDWFAFASEIKALLCLQWIDTRLDENGLADLLLGVFQEPDATLYRGIRQLPPGRLLCVDKMRSRLERFFDWDSARELNLKSEDEYAEAFRETFLRSVQRRMRGSGPIGAALSGGLDSSSIACAAARLARSNGQTPVHTFSAIFPKLPPEELKRADEREYMRAVLASGGMKGHFFEADDPSVFTDIGYLLECAGQAFIGFNVYIHLGMYRMAAGNNARVFLDGIDGDSVVSSGFSLLEHYARRFRWIRLFREARALEVNSGRRFQLRRRLAWTMGFRPALASLWGRFDPRKQRMSIGRQLSEHGFNSRWSEDMKLAERLYHFAQAYQQAPNYRAGHCLHMRYGLHAYCLTLLDSVAARAGVEPRYPYYDKELVELSLATPPSLKLKHGWPRYIQRAAMEGIIPDKVRWRFDKSDLSPNLNRRTLAIIKNGFCPQSAGIWRFYDREFFQKQIATLDQTTTAASNATLYFHKLMVLDCWLRQGEKRQTPRL